MQRDEDSVQELLVLRLQGQGKAIDDTAQNLQQFCYTVEFLGLVNKSGGRRERENGEDLINMIPLSFSA